MKLLDVYALNCGAKIDKPFIYETYFPLPLDKFITFQAQSQQHIDAKNYAYWQDVIDIINPVLHKLNIKIIQVGQPHEQHYQNIIDIRGQTSTHQLAYVLNHSMLHFGPDSFCIHLASAFDIPLVGLYSSTMPEIAGPQFGTPEKQVLFKCYERLKNKKPSFAVQEDPKSINTIKPEEIAAAVFKLLKVDFQIPIETVFTGKKYSSQILRELIPNSPNMVGSPHEPIEIRTDLFHEDNLLGHHLTYLQKAMIVVDKPINIQLLKHFKAHIPLVVYKIKENDNPKYVKDLVNAGFNTLLVSELPENILNNKKIDYYEVGPINYAGPIDADTVNKLKPDLNKLYFRSCKYIANQGQLFASHASVKQNLPLENQYDYQKVIDSEDFWKDLDFYTIVKKLD